MSDKIKILVFIQSPVHLKNWSMICPDNAESFVVGEKRLKLATCSKDLLLKYPVQLIEEKEVEGLFNYNFDKIVFFALHSREIPLKIIQFGWQKKIPVIAVQESHQLVLNQGAINNYLIPCDKIFAASEIEKEWMVSQGVEKSKIDVTGWCFHQSITLNKGRVDEIKTSNKLSLDKKIALLLPIGFNVAGETENIRGQQIKWCKKLIENGWEVIAKPHPAEPLDYFNSFVEKYCSSVKTISNTTPVEELILISDLVMGRGVSQTSFQALLLGVPFLKLDFGDVTPFDSIADAIAFSEKEIVSKSEFLIKFKNNLNSLYHIIFRDHLNVSPEIAKEKVKGLLGSTFLPNKTTLDQEKICLLSAWKFQNNYDGLLPLEKHNPALGSFYRNVRISIEINKIFTRQLSILEDVIKELNSDFPGKVQFAAFELEIFRLIDICFRVRNWKAIKMISHEIEYKYSKETLAPKILEYIKKEKSKISLLSKLKSCFIK